MIAVLTVYVQVCLGVSTLLLYVPVHLAAMHQSGALATLRSPWPCRPHTT